MLESEIHKVIEKTKQISSNYSVFLFEQHKFKVSSEETRFYEAVIEVLIAVLSKCFKPEDFVTLKKGFNKFISELNRLFRTNSFNMKLSWPEFLDNEQKDLPIQSKKRKLKETDYKNFRKNILS